MRYRADPSASLPITTSNPGTYNARRDNLEGFWKASSASRMD